MRKGEDKTQLKAHGTCCCRWRSFSSCSSKGLREHLRRVPSEFLLGCIMMVCKQRLPLPALWDSLGIVITDHSVTTTLLLQSGPWCTANPLGYSIYFLQPGNGWWEHGDVSHSSWLAKFFVPEAFWSGFFSPVTCCKCNSYAYWKPIAGLSISL